jgi:hypothetical protein
VSPGVVVSTGEQKIVTFLWESNCDFLVGSPYRSLYWLTVITDAKQARWEWFRINNRPNISVGFTPQGFAATKKTVLRMSYNL